MRNSLVAARLLTRAPILHAYLTHSAYATIDGAPHLVPYKVEHAIPALALFNRWLAGDKV